MKTIDTSVYVVDDDAAVREAVESLIRSAGFRVRTFESAHEFLASPRAEVPSCLVLDVHLPGLNGFDLQRELARADIQIPIIFLTGYGDIPTSVRAIKAGALEFLTKPFADEDLLNAMPVRTAAADKTLERYASEKKRYANDSEKAQESAQESEKEATQIEAKALRKLRHPSRSRKLKAFMDGVKD